ncbi:hypothetical protein PHLCEN_2v10053 [Hermanssonia centrifuga]|uniref:Uncharacterized protein n=1 Tax=Hermanssonia centrifuga TaxID=98765 RepID=A0A2R6NNU7_9APHY|nr:hypothetical protein PHLCEN_2v10053 [Hermanssonia centrifuga]
MLPSDRCCAVTQSCNSSSWSLLDGDGTITWGPDAELTPVGVAQAQNVSAAWKVQAKAGIPLPQTLYTSPLTRAADTLNITWADILIDKKDFPKPVIIEWLRETIVGFILVGSARGGLKLKALLGCSHL